jgi:hypothetical protein
MNTKCHKEEEVGCPATGFESENQIVLREETYAAIAAS